MCKQHALRIAWTIARSIAFLDFRVLRWKFTYDWKCVNTTYRVPLFCPLPASRKGLRLTLRSALFGEGGRDWRPCLWCVDDNDRFRSPLWPWSQRSRSYILKIHLMVLNVVSSVIFGGAGFHILAQWLLLVCIWRGFQITNRLSKLSQGQLEMIFMKHYAPNPL